MKAIMSLWFTIKTDSYSMINGTSAKASLSRSLKMRAIASDLLPRTAVDAEFRRENLVIRDFSLMKRNVR